MPEKIFDIGMIGLGRMGSRMASRLADAGHHLYVRDVVPAAIEPLARRGAQPCDTPAAVAASCEIVITSLPSPKDVDQVMLGPGGLLAAVRPGTVVIETSTIGPAQSRTLAERFAAQKAFYLDAPISGGIPGAENGTLSVMVGGDAAAFERVQPVLRHIGTDIRHLGPSGAGSAAKLINQIVFLSYGALLCEAVALGGRYGLGAKPLLEILETSLAGRPLSTGWHEKLKSGDTTAGFEIERILKDLSLGAEMSAELGFEAPVFAAALAAYEHARALGYGDRDLSILATLAKGEKP